MFHVQLLQRKICARLILDLGHAFEKDIGRQVEVEQVAGNETAETSFANEWLQCIGDAVVGLVLQQVNIL
jgi:hypothetical protein